MSVPYTNVQPIMNPYYTLDLAPDDYFGKFYVLTYYIKIIIIITNMYYKVFLKIAFMLIQGVGFLHIIAFLT